MDVDGTNVRHVTGSWVKGYPVVAGALDGEHLAYSRPDGWMYLVRTDGERGHPVGARRARSRLATGTVID